MPSYRNRHIERLKMKYDLVIPCHEKDFVKLKYCIQSCILFLKYQVCRKFAPGNDTCRVFKVTKDTAFHVKGLFTFYEFNQKDL